MAHPLQTHYEAVIVLLQPLRSIFKGDGDRQTESQAAFDQFLSGNELELALHVACDFLLTSEANRIESGILTRIEAAHAAMAIEDDCISQLKLRYEERPEAF